MKDKYNRYIEDIVSFTSDEELYRAVLNSGKAVNMKEKQTKKRTAKGVIIPIVAAATVAATSIGVMAVYKRSVDKEYTDIIEKGADVTQQKYRDEKGNIIDQKQKTMAEGAVEKLNFELNKTYDCNGFTVEIPGVVTDGENAFIMYDVLFDKDSEQFDKSCSYSLLPDGKRLLDQGLHTLGLDHGGSWSERDGKAVYSDFVPIGGLGNCSGTVKVELSHIYKKEAHGTDSEVIYTDIDLELPITSEMTKFNKKIKLDTAVDVALGEWDKWVLDTVNVTPLEVSFEVSRGDVFDYRLFKNYGPKIPVIINFKDGSTLDVTEYCPHPSFDKKETKAAVFSQNIKYPINVDDVESVQFMDKVIDMNGEVTVLDVPALGVDYRGENFGYDPETKTFTVIKDDGTIVTEPFETVSAVAE